MVLDSIVCSVSFWTRRRASQDAFENSNIVIPSRGKRGKSLSETLTELEGISDFHALVIACGERITALPPCRWLR
jgi:hypothetical protein